MANGTRINLFKPERLHAVEIFGAFEKYDGTGLVQSGGRFPPGFLTGDHFDGSSLLQHAAIKEHKQSLALTGRRIDIEQHSPPPGLVDFVADMASRGLTCMFFEFAKGQAGSLTMHRGYRNVSLKEGRVLKYSLSMAIGGLTERILPSVDFDEAPFWANLHFENLIAFAKEEIHWSTELAHGCDRAVTRRGNVPAVLEGFISGAKRGQNDEAKAERAALEASLSTESDGDIFKDLR